MNEWQKKKKRKKNEDRKERTKIDKDRIEGMNESKREGERKRREGRRKDLCESERRR